MNSIEEGAIPHDKQQRGSDVDVEKGERKLNSCATGSLIKEGIGLWSCRLTVEQMRVRRNCHL